MYEKENQLGYQLKTRHYSNLNTRQQTRNNEERHELMTQKRYDYPSPNRYTKTAQPETYSRNESSEWSNKCDQGEARPRDYTRQFSNLNRSIGKQSDQTSINIMNKREASRRQQLQMRMNNINTINNKINNLLNLVKKERVYQSKQKFDEISQKYIDRSPSTVHREKIVPSYQEKQEKKDAVVQHQKQQDFEYGKSNNKVLQRLRVLSTLEPNLINRSSKSKQYSKPSPKKHNNQEDLGYERRESAKSSYSDWKNNQSNSIDKYRKQEPRQQKKYEPIQTRYNKYSPTVQKTRQNGAISQKDISVRKYTPAKYQRMDDSRNEQQYNPYRSNFSSSYMPITMIPNQKYASPEGRYNDTYSGLKTVENQIKRIKQRMGESYSPQMNKQRNEFNRQSNNFTPNRRQVPDSTKNLSPAKKFELKIYPVKNDKPQTVKIAEKLCYQIEMDSRMKKSREAFSRIEGEDKWKDLNEKLTKQGIRLTLNELKGLLISPIEKLAQFHTEQSPRKKIDPLAQDFADAQRFWEKHVVGCANLKALRRQGFDSKNLDIQRNGYLTIQDIIDFVNQYTAHSYNNSDIAIVFRRLQLLQGETDSQKVEYVTFLRAFTM